MTDRQTKRITSARQTQAYGSVKETEELVKRRLPHSRNVTGRNLPRDKSGWGRKGIPSSGAPQAESLSQGDNGTFGSGRCCTWWVGRVQGGELWRWAGQGRSLGPWKPCKCPGGCCGNKRTLLKIVIRRGVGGSLWLQCAPCPEAVSRAEG